MMDTHQRSVWVLRDFVVCLGYSMIILLPFIESQRGRGMSKIKPVTAVRRTCKHLLTRPTLITLPASLLHTDSNLWRSLYWELESATHYPFQVFVFSYSSFKNMENSASSYLYYFCLLCSPIGISDFSPEQNPSLHVSWRVSKENNSLMLWSEDNKVC